ncbi:MAG: tyrosine-type recombinase/integrase [Verrucomicrobiales bacterium]|nr:tyrosine-type recombinase/integrase [Verrucomicrobiales bacterium]
MSIQDTTSLISQLRTNSRPHLPALFLDAGEKAWRRVLEFFTANIRNGNTRAAYAQAVFQFAGWCREKGIVLHQISPFLIAAYIEELGKRLAVPSVKQHLAAIRMLFDYLVVGQVVATNPASSVRGPKHVLKKGLTPVLAADEARTLLESIDVSTLIGLRDRALIGVMVYSFARVGATVAMNVEDYFRQNKRCWFRLHEKGGKLHDVPAHHKAQEYIDEYLPFAGGRGCPLFQTVNRGGQLTGRRIHRLDALAMIKRRAIQVGLPASICCHTFRATGITCYLLRGGSLEHAQRIAAHESPRTTKLYDRTSDELSLDEIERIVL